MDSGREIEHRSINMLEFSCKRKDRKRYLEEVKSRKCFFKKGKIIACLLMERSSGEGNVKDAGGGRRAAALS